jgi:hypothetical protein
MFNLCKQEAHHRASSEDRDSSTPPKKKKTSGGSPFSESNGVSMKEVDGSSNGVFKKPNGIPMPSSSSISSSQQVLPSLTSSFLNITCCRQRKT